MEVPTCHAVLKTTANTSKVESPYSSLCSSPGEVNVDLSSVRAASCSFPRKVNVDGSLSAGTRLGYFEAKQHSAGSPRGRRTCQSVIW